MVILNVLPDAYETCHMTLKALHTLLNGRIGQHVGVGVSHTLAQAYFRRSVAGLATMPPVSVPLPVFELAVGAQIIDDPAATFLEFPAPAFFPRVALKFKWAIQDKQNPQKVYRTVTVTYSGIEAEVVVLANGKPRLALTRAGPSSSIFDTAMPDQTLIDDPNGPYKGNLNLYLAHESAVLLQGDAFVAEFVRQLPFPDVLGAMSDFQIAAPYTFTGLPTHAVISSKNVDFTPGNCVPGGSSRSEMSVKTGLFPQSQVATPDPRGVRPKRSVNFDITHTVPQTDRPPPDPMERFSILLYLGKTLSYDIVKGSAITRMGVRWRAADESFFVRWYAQASAGIDQATASVGLDQQAATAKAHFDASASGSAGATIKIGCIDLFSGSVGLDGTFTVDLLARADIDQHNQEIRTKSQATLANLSFSIYGLPFPLNMVANLILHELQSDFALRVAVEGTNAFRLSLLDLLDLSRRSGVTFGSLNVDALQNSQLLAVGPQLDGA